MRKSKGFTLIELLIVVAIIGIIAAVAIPNLNRAINKGKQKATMADMKQIGTFLSDFWMENDEYPMVKDMNALAKLLEPKYTRQLKRRDSWDHQFYYNATSESYTIASCGKGGPDICISPASTDYNSVFDTIIFADGVFVQGPLQQQ